MKNILLKCSMYCMLMLILNNAYAQQRYLSEVFTSVNITTNVQYAENYSIFPFGTATLIPLVMDVYEPAGDVSTQRPVIILMHTGSYFPRYCNETPTGDRNDSATVELATQFAKRGYVVANIDYRLGWNPASTNVDARRGTLLQAVYRSIQDAKACVRFFKKDFSTTNIYKIDTAHVILGGQGTGGYIALNYISLDKPAELNIPKLISGTTDLTIPIVAGQSYIDQSLFGDLEGYGGDPAFNNANNSTGYSSKVSFAFNLGGALGDSTWIEPGDAPTVAFHVVGDPFAPYGPGIVWVPGTPPQSVIDVIGSGSVLAFANQYGNNNCFSPNPFNDSYTVAANSVNNGYEGLFPFNMVPALQSGPWEWWDSTTVALNAPLCGEDGTVIHMNALMTNPDMSKQKAMAYIDTVMGYLNPRMAFCMNLVGLNESDFLSANISLGPNPSSSSVSLSWLPEINPVSVVIMDIAGRELKNIDVPSNSSQLNISTSELSTGNYVVTIQTKNAVARKKIIVSR